MVKKKSVKKPVRRPVRKPKKAKSSRIVPIKAPDYKVDLSKHTVKTTAPEVHVIGQKPKTAHDIFMKKQKQDGTEMKFEYDTVQVTESKGARGWIRKYSPVLITVGIGLLTYLYLIFYMFYPAAVEQGKYVTFLMIISFLFLAAGILLFLGLKSELLFVRILSFIFVFVVFTFLLLFILVSYALTHKSAAV